MTPDAGAQSPAVVVRFFDGERHHVPCLTRAELALLAPILMEPWQPFTDERAAWFMAAFAQALGRVGLTIDFDPTWQSVFALLGAAPFFVGN